MSESMNALIIYDSTFGNTQQIAKAIARELEEHGDVQLHPVQEVGMPGLREFDLLLLGCPTQNLGVSPAIDTFLTAISPGTLHGMMAAAFDTRYRMAEASSGSAAWVIADQLQEAGASLISSPESFFVAAEKGPLEDGELDRAEQWAHDLFDKYERIQSNENRHSYGGPGR
jgi:flavodoxin